MIAAPQGMAACLPPAAGMLAASQPANLFVGAAPGMAVQQTPLQVTPPLVGGGLGAPAIPGSPVVTAGTGASIIGMPAPVVGGASPITMPVAPAPVTPMPVFTAMPLVGGAATAPAPVVATIGASPTLLGPAGAAPAATAGAAALGAPLATGAAAAPAGAAPITSLAPGADPADGRLVDRALGMLRGSQAGAMMVDRLLAVGAKINVVSDAEFASMGHGDAHAFYDPKIDTMFLRRSQLQDDANIGFAAVALAHEGTHLLDDLGGVGDQLVAKITQDVVAAGGLDTQAGIAARDQGLFELTMVKETRAFVFAGQVARELGVAVGPEDPTAVAIDGGNDRATYERVWQRLLQSSYNEQGRSAPVRIL